MNASSRCYTSAFLVGATLFPQAAHAVSQSTARIDDLTFSFVGANGDPLIPVFQTFLGQTYSEARWSSADGGFDLYIQKNSHTPTALNSTSPVPANEGYAASAQGTYSGGLGGTFIATGYTDMVAGNVDAYAGISYGFVMPIGSSVTISGHLSISGYSLGVPIIPGNMVTSAEAEVIFSPQLLYGSVFVLDSGGTPSGPSWNISFAQGQDFSYAYTNLLGIPQLFSVSMNVYIADLNAALPVPEQSKTLSLLSGLALLGWRLRRTRSVRRA